MAQQNISDPMQRDAVRRMQEMHSRAGRQSGTSTGKTEQGAQEENNTPPPATPVQPQNNKSAPAAAPDLPFNIQELFAEKDKNLILIIILLLLGEHSDTSLIMALVYLIL